MRNLKYFNEYRLFESSEKEDIYRDYFYDLIDEGVFYKRLNFPNNSFVIYLDCYNIKLIRDIVHHINQKFC